MTDERVDPIDRDLGVLLEAERSAEPAGEVLARVWDRVHASSGGAGGRPGAGPERGPGWLTKHAISVAVCGALVVGSGVGWGVSSWQRSPAGRVVPVYVPMPVVLPSVRTPMLAPSELASPPMAAPSPSVPTRETAPAPSSSLAAERALLDGARAALTAGDAARCLSLLGEHARRFARPQLGEEREALAVQALVTLGRYDEARARAARLRSSAPHSLFLPAVDSSLGSIP